MKTEPKSNPRKHNRKPEHPKIWTVEQNICKKHHSSHNLDYHKKAMQPLICLLLFLSTSQKFNKDLLHSALYRYTPISFVKSSVQNILKDTDSSKSNSTKSYCLAFVPLTLTEERSKPRVYWTVQRPGYCERWCRYHRKQLEYWEERNIFGKTRCVKKLPDITKVLRPTHVNGALDTNKSGI